MRLSLRRKMPLSFVGDGSPERGISVFLGDAVFAIESVDAPRVPPHDREEHNERALRRDPETEGPAEEVEAQFTREVGREKRDAEPHDEQDAGDAQVAKPIDFQGLAALDGFGLLLGHGVMFARPLRARLATWPAPGDSRASPQQ